MRILNWGGEQLKDLIYVFFVLEDLRTRGIKEQVLDLFSGLSI